MVASVQRFFSWKDNERLPPQNALESLVEDPRPVRVLGVIQEEDPHRETPAATSSSNFVSPTNRENGNTTCSSMIPLFPCDDRFLRSVGIEPLDLLKWDP